MIEIDALTKHFGHIRAVDHLTFNVQPGEVLGFLGPNGAGKSTTMKMLTGFLRPTSGTARIHGLDIRTQPVAAKRLLGYLPEGAPAYGDMTVIQFLNFIAAVRGLTGREGRERLNRVIEEVHLAQVLRQKIDTLSKGFRGRVGLAQAILHDPQVLILDEPTDGLDPNQKHEVRNLIRGMSSDKIIIVSTHILEEVDAVCTRAMIIGHGRILADGTPDELAALSPRHGAVIIHFAHPPENPQPELAKVAGVRDITMAADGLEATVLAKPGAHILPGVARAVENRGWEIDGLHQQRGRLDEVFRDVTGGAAA